MDYYRIPRQTLLYIRSTKEQTSLPVSVIRSLQDNLLNKRTFWQYSNAYKVHADLRFRCFHEGSSLQAYLSYLPQPS